MNAISIRQFALSALAASLLALTGCGPTESAKKPVAQAPAQSKAGSIGLALCLNDKCGVLDQYGKILLGFENNFDNILVPDMNGNVFVAEDGQWSLLSTNGGNVLKDKFGDSFVTLPNGLFSYQKNGKYNLNDAKGQELQPARFDDIYPSGDNSFILYEIDGKRGLLSNEGEVISEALYDSTIVQDDFADHAMLVPAERGEQPWLIDLKNRTQKEVEFQSIKEMHDDHLVVRNIKGEEWLVDASGKSLTPKGFWIGHPSNGLVAFRAASDSSCGYFDYQGKVIIPARFYNCEPFGKQGALAQEQTADGSPGKYGFIDRQGQWKIEPLYDEADDAGLSPMGYTNVIPGYASIGKALDFQHNYGIFSTDEGKEIFPPSYPLIGALGKGLFVFSDDKAPRLPISLMGQMDEAPAVGVMDATGRRLVEPRDFTSARLDRSENFIQTLNGISNTAQAGLYDLQGRPVIAASGQEVVVDQKHDAILVYAVTHDGDDETRSLMSVHDLQGNERFSVRDLACDQRQIIDGSGKAIWPASPVTTCNQADQTKQ